MTRSVVLAVDCSTTASKVVAFDPHGRAISESRRYLALQSPRPGWQEQDATQWWEATADALAAVMQSLDPGDRPVAIGLTHQRESFVCVDKTGVPIRPAILWVDGRAREQIARLGSPEIHAVTGKPASTAPSLYKLAWLAEHEPQTLAATATVLDVHGYLVARLTGERATSWASADSTALVDLSTFSWAPALVELAGLRLDQLPRLVAPGTVVGTISRSVALRTGVPEGLRVIAGAGDGQCAGLGVGVTKAGMGYLNLGTSLSFGMHTDQYRWDRAYRTLASPMPAAYNVESLLASGGLSLTWFRDALSGVTGDRREEELQAMAFGVPAGALGLLFVPHLSGAETPYWDTDARASFIGLGPEHGRAEMYRAVLEGLAYEQRLSLKLMEESIGQTAESIVVTGGASQSRLFTQVLADVLQRPIGVSAERESTALGAAIVAAAATNTSGYSSLAEAAATMTHISHVVEPDPRLEGIYSAAANLHAEIYPQLRGIWPRLAALRRPPEDQPEPS